MFIRVWKPIVSQDANRFYCWRATLPILWGGWKNWKCCKGLKRAWQGLGVQTVRWCWWAGRRGHCAAVWWPDCGVPLEEAPVGEVTAAGLLRRHRINKQTNKQTETKTHPKEPPRNKRTKKASHQQNTFPFMPFSFCRMMEFPEECTDAGVTIENILQGFSLRSCRVSGWERRASPSGRTPG